MNPRFGIRAQHNGRVYETIRYVRPQRADQSRKVTKKVIKEVETHLQLRHSSDEWKKIWWAEDYNLSLKFLYELFFVNQEASS